MGKASIAVRLLVTDKGAVLLGEASSDSGDRERTLEAIRDAVVYEGARRVEIRDFAFDVEILDSPEIQRVEPAMIHVEPQEIKELIDDELDKRKVREANRTWDLFMQVMPPGCYHFYRDDRGSGMRRLDEDEIHLKKERRGAF